MLDEEDLVYFLHIPKTAGTSLVNVLENQFNYNCIYRETIYPELFKNFPRNLSNYKLIRGHFGYWVTKLLTKKPVILTMLRNPREQITSLFNHQLRAFKKRDKYSLIKKNHKNITDVLKDPKLIPNFRNHHIRHLTLDIDIPKEKNQEIMKTLRPKLNSNSQDELLEIAKNRLKDFAFFGLTEKFEETLQLLYYTFAWYPVRTVPKLNINPNKLEENLSSETKDLIQTYTKEDQELYKFAEPIFESRYSEMIRDLKDQYYKPKHDEIDFNDAIYKMLEKHYLEKNREKIKYSKNISYSFEKQMIGSGWHSREQINENVCRWSGPESRSDIYFPLSNEVDLKIRITILNQIASDVLRSLELYVNNYNVELELKSQKRIWSGGKTCLEATISKSFIPQGKFTCLNFRVNRTKNPLISNILLKNTRKIGLLFSKIEMLPL
jgi:hypothetical protein